MKASELRIGNWINNGFGLQLIKDGGDIDLTEVNGASEIKLDDEWLRKFGFRQYGVEMVYVDFILAKSPKGFTMEIDCICGAECKCKLDMEIKYVHQLQNIYFALYGKELTTKE